jgi:hypothetical protein
VGKIKKNMKQKYIIGIDPDCDKSGVATIRTDDKSIECKTLEFPLLLNYLRYLKEVINRTESVIVLVEASWLIKHNWHAKSSHNSKYAASIGNKTGRNHETGRKIVEMCRYYNLEVLEVAPLKKIWKGTDGKISHEEISHFIPEFPKRSNQEMRDSALLAWNLAGFPIKVKRK